MLTTSLVVLLISSATLWFGCSKNSLPHHTIREQDSTDSVNVDLIMHSLSPHALPHAPSPSPPKDVPTLRPPCCQADSSVEQEEDLARIAKVKAACCTSSSRGQTRDLLKPKRLAAFWRRRCSCSERGRAMAPHTASSQV